LKFKIGIELVYVATCRIARIAYPSGRFRGVFGPQLIVLFAAPKIGPLLTILN
jgi:hypothetical protein